MNVPKPQIQPLQEHMTPSQNANLVQILEMGQVWKEEGERLEMERWTSGAYNGRNFSNRLRSLEWLLSLRQKEYEAVLTSINYFERGKSSQQKFIKEYVEDYLIYYTPYSPSGYIRDLRYSEIITQPDLIVANRNSITLDTEDVWCEWVKYVCDLIERTWWFREWIHVNLSQSNMRFDSVEFLSQTILNTWGLQRWVKLWLDFAKLSSEWFTKLAESICKTWWLREWVEISLFGTYMSVMCGITIAKMIRDINWLKKWVSLDLTRNHIKDTWTIAIAEAIKETWGLPEWVLLNLSGNQIWSQGVIAIIEAIEHTGGLQPWVDVNLSDNNHFSNMTESETSIFIERIQKLRAWSKWHIDVQ